jgi:hypothetical protein
MQPVYSDLARKIEARARNIAAYRHLTGNQEIPPDREYWTLCNLQPDTHGSEIVQLEYEGLLQKHQFHGVDNNASYIEQNRLWHPDANWHEGDWLSVIQSVHFNPSMIYLDTTGLADSDSIIRLAKNTMLRCPSQTVVVINSMLTDPYSGRRIDRNALNDGISRLMSRSSYVLWDKQIRRFIYNATGKTDMLSCIFYKP